jgi:ComF family protein
VHIAVEINSGYTFGIGPAGASFCRATRKVVFSESVKVVQLGNGGPPGTTQGAASGWRAVTRVLRSTSQDLVNTLFPSDCHICGGPIIALSHAPVCEACIAKLQPQPDAAMLCGRCGEALGMESLRFASAMGMSDCTMCRLVPPEFERAVAYADYDEEVRELLHLFKFNGMSRIARSILAEGMAAAVLKLQPQAANDLLVIPVPLFRARERSRGFNQAQLLAEAALATLRVSQPNWKLELRNDILARTRDTNASFAMNPSARRKNLQGAFKVANPAELRNREVLLIDDILTTGATARECSRVLRRAGATKVWVATFARAQEAQVLNETGIARWDAPTNKPREPDTIARQTFLN